MLFPHAQLRILGYHRLIRDLNGLDAGGFLERLSRAGFDLRERQKTRAAAPRQLRDVPGRAMAPVDSRARD